MRLVWAEPAIADLEGMRGYIARDSEAYGERFVQRIVEAVETLVHAPRRGRVVPEASQPDVRELLFRNYRIM